MLKLNGITLQEGEARILEDVSLEVAEDEIISILGPSGSGKTSLLRVIMGLALPRHGAVLLDGNPLTENGRHQIPPARRPFSYLFQEFTLFPHLTVKENILLAAQSLKKDEKQSQLERFTEMLGIRSLTSRHIHTLSGGEQQRVALARTLMTKPRFLLLDEPFSNVDRMTRLRLWRDIKPILRAEGMSALLATHDREEAFFFSDQLTVLSEGRIVAVAPPQELYSNPGTAWMAGFTGDAHILDRTQFRAIFDKELPEEGDAFLVRPEDIKIQPGDTAKITDIEFCGDTTRLTLEISDAPQLTSLCLGATSHSVGDRLGLSLRKNPVKVTL